MKSIRYTAGLLLILTGIVHSLPFFTALRDSHSIPMLVFGIVYFIIGILLILKIKYSDVLGIIFPLIGIGTGFFVIGFQHWDRMLSLLIATDAIVAGCCFYLFFYRNKKHGTGM
jgi:uncharacterized membrane protein HdeD (DUF308 family)